MPKSFTKIEINADPQLNEQLIAILSQLGFEGFWEEVSQAKPSLREDEKLYVVM